MKKIKINLNAVEKVKRFVRIAESVESSLDIISGRYAVDAKSIMGIFSMDLSRPVTLQIHDENLDIHIFDEYLA